MGSIGQCCCCPLTSKPFLRAQFSVWGADFDIAFPDTPVTEANCCQTTPWQCQELPIEELDDCTLYPDPDNWAFPLGYCQLPGTELTECGATDCGPFFEKIVSDCCGEGTPQTVQLQTKQRTRIVREWWRAVAARVIVCACETHDGKQGYDVRIETYFFYSHWGQSTFLTKYRYRILSRDCTDGSCIVGDWTDDSGSDTPIKPPNNRPALSMGSGFWPCTKPSYSGVLRDGICTLPCAPENCDGGPFAGYYYIEDNFESIYNHCFWTGGEDETRCYINRREDAGLATGGGSPAFPVATNNLVSHNLRTAQTPPTTGPTCQEDPDPETDFAFTVVAAPRASLLPRNCGTLGNAVVFEETVTGVLTR